MVFYLYFFFNSQSYSIPSLFFFFNDTATTEIYTLSLHDALPIYAVAPNFKWPQVWTTDLAIDQELGGDRKSTRLNSSHGYISYAVFCLKKKKYTSYHQLEHRIRST